MRQPIGAFARRRAKAGNQRLRLAAGTLQRPLEALRLGFVDHVRRFVRAGNAALDERACIRGVRLEGLAREASGAVDIELLVGDYAHGKGRKKSRAAPLCWNG